MVCVNNFLEKAHNKYGNFYDYNMGSFQGMTKKMEIICPTHGMFEQTPKNHLLSKFGCPLCANSYKTKKKVITDKKRIGSETITNAGFHIKCIEYRRCDDITVLFDDGTKVYTSWYYFKNGAIDHPQHKNVRKAASNKYIGMTAYSTYGELMTVVAARKRNDIDVRFPDGSIAEHKSLSSFLNGEIKRPTQTAEDIFVFHKKHRLGEKKMQKNGMVATIVEYQKNYIIAEFEDGRRRRSTYSMFAKGLMMPPEIHTVHDTSRIGERRTLSDGHVIEIIEYDSSQHLTILIDGTKKKHTNYRWFNKAVYVDANSQKQCMGTAIIKKERRKKVGSVSYNIYTGEKMVIVKYDGNSNVTVRFEDGTIVNDVRYQNFKLGLVMNPNRPNRNQVSINEFAVLYCLRSYGFVHAKRGSLKKIGLGNKELDVYNPKHKIGIEYDGRMHTIEKDIAKNNACKENGIKLYRIQESTAPVIDSPNCYRLTDDTALSNALLKAINNIISDINQTTDLNIDFVRKFDKQGIKSEFYDYTYTVNDIVGMSRHLSNGDIITISRYGGYNDIDISLSNGKIIKHKTLQAFKKYSWTNQIEYNKAFWEGKSQVVNGRIFRIITYQSSKEILVRCEDGFETIISKHSWVNGKIFHRDDIKISSAGGLMKDRTGENGISLIGLNMTITEYIDCKNMTVTFSDGRTAHNVTYQAFNTGHVAPDGTNILSERLRLQRIGEKQRVNSGKVYTIIEYRSSDEILIQDERGNTKTCSYYDFKRGKVA